MEELSEAKSSLKQKQLMAVGITILVLLIIVSVFIRKQRIIREQTNSTGNIIAPTIKPEDKPYTYASPLALRGAKYNAFDEIGFIPEQVNAVMLDRHDLKRTAAKIYPNLSEEELLQKVNFEVFAWLALKDFNGVPDAQALELQQYKVKDFSRVEKEYNQLVNEYHPDMKVDGFFVKAKFTDVPDANLRKLHKKSSELRSYAYSVIKRYAQSATNDSVVDHINNEPAAVLLNNGERSQKFYNYEFEPILIDDARFGPLLATLPEKKISDIYILKRRTKDQVALEEYEYAAFFVSKRVGTMPPLNILINSFIERSTIK